MLGKKSGGGAVGYSEYPRPPRSSIGCVDGGLAARKITGLIVYAIPLKNR